MGNRNGLTRRSLLRLSLGASQLALLGGIAGVARGRRARAQDSTTPTRLLTIYLSGGYAPQYFYAPFTAPQVGAHIMAPQQTNERIGYAATQIESFGAGGDGFSPIRVARTWDPATPSNRGANREFLPLGYSWIEHDLFPHTVVLHGIDQGTASHASGYIAAMCGVAGSEYRAPAVQSVIANHLYDRFADTRPLPCVGFDARGLPNAFDLPARSAASFVPDINAVRRSLSDGVGSNPWWQGVNLRTDGDDVDFTGAVVGTARQTRIERAVLARARAQRARSSAGTDAFLEALHDGYRGVSKALAQNIADTLESTPGVEHLPEGNALFAGAAPYSMGRFGYTLGYADANFTDGMFEPTFDMALRVMKADLASSLHIYMPTFYFDTHAGQAGHFSQYLLQRGAMDVIARFLGEMKLTTLASGKTLLDDTLVMIFSEFARTWASFDGVGGGQYPDDHWPTTTVTLVGGGMNGGREIGAFDLDGFSYGPAGAPVEIVEESGETNTRAPRAADVTTTVCKILGLDTSEFFIPGGYGEIVGARRT